MPEPGTALHPALAVIGAGPVGMTLALAAKRHGQDVVLLDARPPASWSSDPRAIALSEGSRQMLAALGAWPSTGTTAILEVHVSQRGGFGRTLLSAADQNLPALGHVVAYRDLCRTLAEATAAAGIEIRHATPATSLGTDGAGVRLATPCGEIRCGIAVHAEGGGAEGSQVFDYEQDALLCEVEPATPHAGRAWERFTPDGPLALLPCGRRLAVVMVCRRDAAASLLELDDAGFCAVLEQRMSGRLRFAATTPRVRMPLALRIRERTAAGREFWIGNAAQTLHPVSGQGLNLGLRDAWEFADAFAAAGTDPLDRLTRSLRGRRIDRLGGIAFTDGIVRVFSNDLAPLRLARGVGLAVLDFLPPARRFLATRMIFGTRP